MIPRLLHGSKDNNLKPGTVIRPDNPLNYSNDETPLANATTNKDVASSFARAGDDKGGTVYTVKPVSRMETFKTSLNALKQGELNWRGHVVSKKGFVVTGVDSTVEPDAPRPDLTNLYTKNPTWRTWRP
jgi:hypothetical protein